MRVLSFQDIVNSILEKQPLLADTRLVAVDGRSGSGKSTFAARLGRSAVRRGIDIAVVHTDDLLGGWGDPKRFDARLRDWIVGPLQTGRHASYRCYNWHTGAFSTDWCHIGRPDVLVVDGVTTAGTRWRPMLSYAVLLEADAELCRRRGLARDGETIRAELEAWHRAEEEHFRADPPEVDLIVAGDPPVPHDVESQCVALDEIPRDPASTTSHATVAELTARFGYILQ